MYDVLHKFVELSGNFYSEVKITNGHWSQNIKDTANVLHQQLLKNTLEQFLILLALQDDDCSPYQPIKKVLENNHSNPALFQKVCDFFEENIDSRITLTDLCLKFGCCRTTIGTIFKEAVGMGPIQYFNMLKIEKSKILLRESTYNITEIASLLGFSNAHYFSNSFKKVVGMFPTQYVKSIKQECRVIYYRPGK